MDNVVNTMNQISLYIQDKLIEINGVRPELDIDRDGNAYYLILFWNDTLFISGDYEIHIIIPYDSDKPYEIFFKFYDHHRPIGRYGIIEPYIYNYTVHPLRIYDWIDDFVDSLFYGKVLSRIDYRNLERDNLEL